MLDLLNLCQRFVFIANEMHKMRCLIELYLMLKDLQSFADGAEHGLIIFTLGSNSQVSSMAHSVQQIFFRVFGRLKQRVIWKWEKESFSDLPSNIKLVDWMPQQDLLGKRLLNELE